VALGSVIDATAVDVVWVALDLMLRHSRVIEDLVSQRKLASVVRAEPRSR
jgi:hypothetical protein